MSIVYASSSLPSRSSKETGVQAETTAQVSIAVAQVPATRGALDRNLETTIEHIDAAGDLGHDLIVFPECNLSGYMFDSPEQTRAAAIGLTDPRLGRLIEACRKNGVQATVGLL